MNRFARFALALGIASAPLFALDAGAQGWPSKPVKVIISQPPGTAPDIITRLLTDGLPGVHV
jgi:tripartite-type tricarboxylate transporter receptor subunit TctC